MPYYKVEFWTGNEQEGSDKKDAIRKVIQRIKDQGTMPYQVTGRPGRKDE